MINRGNYRQDLFRAPGTAEAFEKTLGETCDKCGWELGAYCIMGNHFHLALATPNGNLVEGMHWLQSTFGNRFNRFFGENGHVFQGRYKAILVEPGLHWARVVDYIHLNPARAGIVSVANLGRYPWSSLPKFPRRKSRPAHLHCEDWLGALGELDDDRTGWRLYRKHLEGVFASNSDEDDRKLNVGWILGSESYRKAVLKDFEQMNLARDWGGPELRELNEMQWEQVLVHCLKNLGKSRSDIQREIKSVEWKAAIAWWLKSRTSAGNRWLGEKLNMGHPAMVSRLAKAFDSDVPDRKRRSYERKFTSKS